jgi:DNA-binding LytR/AlgR family response regulator
VFARVHRSSIVRLDAIRRTKRARNGAHEVTLASGQRVAVSRSGWTALRGRVTTTDTR